MNAVKTFTNYLKSSFEELKKVSWPSQEETMRYSWIVIIMSLALAFFFGAFDFLLSAGFEYLIDLY